MVEVHVDEGAAVVFVDEGGPDVDRGDPVVLMVVNCRSMELLDVTDWTALQTAMVMAMMYIYIRFAFRFIPQNELIDVVCTMCMSQ